MTSSTDGFFSLVLAVILTLLVAIFEAIVWAVARHSPMSTPPPKEPHHLSTIYAQIEAHPRFSQTNTGFQTMYGAQCIEGRSWNMVKTRQWARACWRRLYLGTPVPQSTYWKGDIFDA